MLERANISRYCLAKYSKEEPLTPVAITTFDGGAGMKYINASETMPTMHKLAANPLNSCQRLYPSMNISPGSQLKTTIGRTQKGAQCPLLADIVAKVFLHCRSKILTRHSCKDVGD